MNAEDFKGNPGDRELYERLLAERNGPVAKLLAERDPVHRKARGGSDPEASRRLAELQEGETMTSKGRRRMTAEQAPQPEPDTRTPPVPGAVWCGSCDSWCLPPGICRCNNR